MSDQRKLRSDAKQGFHQFAMHLYQSYLQSHSEKEAKLMVAESIKEQLGLFMGSDAGYGDVAEVISKKIIVLKEQLHSSGYNYDLQMKLSEQIDALEKTQELLGL